MLIITEQNRSEITSIHLSSLVFRHNAHPVWLFFRDFLGRAQSFVMQIYIVFGPKFREIKVSEGGRGNKLLQGATPASSLEERKFLTRQFTKWHYLDTLANKSIAMVSQNFHTISDVLVDALGRLESKIHLYYFSAKKWLHSQITSGLNFFFFLTWAFARYN